jgi:hypothetical protein
MDRAFITKVVDIVVKHWPEINQEYQKRSMQSKQSTKEAETCNTIVQLRKNDSVKGAIQDAIKVCAEQIDGEWDDDEEDGEYAAMFREIREALIAAQSEIDKLHADVMKLLKEKWHGK